jgi:hypothetical protein
MALLFGSSNLDIQMCGIVDNIVFSKKSIWAFYEVDTTGYDFLNEASKASMLRSINQTFVNLVANRETELNCHLIVTNTPVDIDHWEEQYLKVSENWARKPGFNKFFADQVEYLKTREFLSRKVYIGIRIGDRYGVNAAGFFKELASGWKQAYAYIDDFTKSLRINDYSVTEKEVSQAESPEKEFFSMLHSSALNCQRPEAEEIALIMKRTMYPAMPTPYLDVPANGRWGQGDIIRETGSDITKNRRWTEISQPIGGQILTGYRATLTFSKFPEQMSSPLSTPWIYMMQRIGIPFDMYARFAIIPSKSMKKKISRQKADIMDEAKNAGEVNIDAPLDLQEDYQKAAELEQYADKNNEPFLNGIYRMVITAPGEDELINIVDVVKTTYSNGGITITWTAGDQQDLLLESMPGDDIREKSFMQSSNTELIGASGFNIYNKVGDDDRYNASRER